MTDDVIDLAAARRKKKVEEDLARGRTPLHVSHLDGFIRGGRGDDFGSRLIRIRESLAKINRLMDELRKSAEVARTWQD